MVASQNGWRANDRSVITSIDVPGGKLSVHNGGIATIFQHLANRFHNEVEPLVWPGNWGYAEREVRGSTDISNHASGTAIDLNAPKHPLGTNPAANYSAAQINSIHNIVNFYEGIIRWGGSYVGRKDGMHFEINDGITEDQVARIANKVRGGGTPVPAPAAPAPVRTANVLPAGAALRPGEKLVVGGWEAVMQTDGNFVIYANGRAQWASHTDRNPGAFLTMQTDGNLVVYTAGGKPIWSVNIQGRGGNRLIMQEDGNLVVYTAANKPVWSRS